MWKRKFLFISIVSIILCAFTSGCAPAASLVEQFGDDGYYFLGMLEQEKGDSKAAVKSFNNAVQKADPYFARLAMQELLKYGSKSEQIQAANKLHKAFSDEETLLVIARKLYADGELSQLIKLTDKIDLETCEDELAYYRIIALYKKNNPKFRNSYYWWCTLKPFTSYHYKLYCEVADLNDVINMRANIYNRDYGRAYTAAKRILQDEENFKAQILSDAGKAFLYGSDSYQKNGDYFEKLARQLDDSVKFYGYFYAGRIYSRMENMVSYSMEKFAQAMASAQTDRDYDTALWYYLNQALSSSIREAVSALERYADTWHDSEYFDDFFDTLSVRILSQHMWDEFYSVTKFIDGHASPATSARFAYVSARLMQEGFLKAKDVDAEEEIKRLFESSMDCGNTPYYLFLAAKKLELTDEEIISKILNRTVVENFQRNELAEKHLEGLLEANLDANIYEVFQSKSSELGYDVTKRVALRLRRNAQDKTDLYNKSMRVALKRNSGSDMPYDEEYLKLIYPKAFDDYVQVSAKKYSLPDYLVYGLIRSESFFDPVVKSGAGAKGLTQLMDSTAADVARKLHVAEYDLADPEINIEFGTYYLSELMSRLDDSMLLSLFAYNGGISRVRNWVASAQTEFSRNTLPNDIFLESIPYSETREYGRKVVAAGCMYAYLYEKQSFSETVERMMR